MLRLHSFIYLIILLIPISSWSQDIFSETIVDYNTLNNEQKNLVDRVTDTDNAENWKYITFGDIASLQSNGQLEFEEPFSGNTLLATATRVKYQDENNFTWTGKIENGGSGNFISIIRNEGGTIGMLKNGNDFYFMHPLDTQRSILTK